MEKELKHDEQFMNLLVQVKFLRAEVFYTIEEQTALRKWLSSQNHQKLQEIFETEIIRKNLQPKTYAGSSLEKIFQELNK